MNCPDNYSQWEAHEAEAERWLASRPVCSECNEPIQDDDCYEFNGDLICPHCLETYHRRSTDDFIF